ncbi:carbonic anhydrase [Methyloferula stellata]|uniref:carbonic anhydrase n=1 Tax=Methyloferula stellata TaxID=876270 RepID=UPI00047EA42F|nr:carbonic anhydrase [Methyloferula stellata]
MCEFCESQNVSHTFSRRGLVKALGAGAVGFAVAGPAFAKPTKAPPKPQNVVSPDEALDLLKAGNARYVAGIAKRHDFKHEREPLTLGQNPYAAILSCADSRIAPEYAFDTARGDLFVCRVAGNFATDENVASFEYAVAILNTPLIMVLGHDACGAVDATIKSLKDNEILPGHLPSLVAAIAPAVKASEGKAGDPLANAIRENVILTVQKLKSATPIISAAVEKGKIRIVGATYRLADGHVELVA